VLQKTASALPYTLIFINLSLRGQLKKNLMQALVLRQTQKQRFTRFSYCLVFCLFSSIGHKLSPIFWYNPSAQILLLQSLPMIANLQNLSTPSETSQKNHCTKKFFLFLPDF
jgi:hypothetical protein